VEQDGGVFDYKENLTEILQKGPSEAAKKVIMPGKKGPLPSRWTLRAVQASVEWLKEYSLSGVWQVLRGSGLTLRSAQMRHWSPDPDYENKLTHLLECMKQTAVNPQKIAFLFWDQMGFYRWPEPALTWAPCAPAPAPIAHVGGGNNRQWRLIGTLNAINGQVDFLDNYIVGRKQVIQMYQQIHNRYRAYKHIFVAQDNWSIHQHPDVVAALKGFPKIEPVWLPTYSPWLNPIEKLWRWLRVTVLKMHRLAEDWNELLSRVYAFLNQFAKGSQDLLHYVGLLGTGKLARAIAVP
jgi:putative transposase